RGASWRKAATPNSCASRAYMPSYGSTRVAAFWAGTTESLSGRRRPKASGAGASHPLQIRGSGGFADGFQHFPVVHLVAQHQSRVRDRARFAVPMAAVLEQEELRRQMEGTILDRPVLHIVDHVAQAGSMDAQQLAKVAGQGRHEAFGIRQAERQRAHGGGGGFFLL